MSPLELDELFEALEFSNPHTLFIGLNFELLKIGKGFKKSISFEGKHSIGEVFNWTDDKNFEKLKANNKQLLFLETKDGLKRYKVSGRHTEWGYVLHGSPVINSNFQISEYNLTLSDFSQQDYIVEYLFLLQASTKAMDELQGLNNEFKKKNKDLDESRRELLNTSLFPQENPNPVLRIDEDFKLLYANKSAEGFLVDFELSSGTLMDDGLMDRLKEMKDQGVEDFSTYIKRNQKTYLLHIKKKAQNNFYNLYGADITHFVDEVAQKERELIALNAKVDQQREFYEYILNNIPSDIAVFDDQHKYMFVNPQGISDPEIRAFMIGKDDYDYCAYKGVASTGADFRRFKFNEVMASNQEIEWEDNLIDSKGNRKTVMRRMRPIFNPLTNQKNVVGYGIDITQRKLAEDAVVASQQRLVLLEQFMDAASDAISVSDLDGNVVYMNKSATARFGYEDNKWSGLRISDLDLQFKKKPIWSKFIKDLRVKKQIFYEAVNINQKTKDGIDVEVFTKWVEFDGTEYVISASRDISERKKSAQVLAYKNDFQNILMGIAAEYIDLDPKELKGSISLTLKKMGEFIRVDRVYIFDYDFKKQTTSNTYEWVADGINPEIDNLQNIPFDMVPDWISSHTRGLNIEVQNTAELPDGHFKNMLLVQDIKSLFALPLMYEGQCLGFVGFDAVKNTRYFYDDEKILLKLFANMLVNVRVKIRNIQAVESSNLKIIKINKELKKNIQAEKTVNQMAETFMSGNEAIEISWEIVENIISHLDFEDCSIFQLKSNQLVKVAAFDKKTKKQKAFKNTLKITVGQGIVGAVAKTGKAICVKDTKNDSRYMVGGEVRASEMAVPIKIGKKVWGVINSEHSKKGFFTDLHLRVLMTIANMFAQRISVLEEEASKIKLQKEILKINADLEQRVALATNRNIELTKSMSDQEKLVTIGEIASGIAHDLNTPLGAIKIGAESIRFTLENLFHDVISKCSSEQLNRACNRAIERQGELFVGGLQQRKEMRELDNFIISKYPNVTEPLKSQMVTWFVKTRILPDQLDLINEIIVSPNPIAYLDLMYSIQIVRNFIDTILTSSDRAAKVVQDLRSFIKDKRNDQKGNVNLYSNIATVLSVFNYEIKRNVDLQFEVDKKLYIEGFEIKLFQLWSNIIKNAIESMDEERGLIRIKSKTIKKKVYISISNNGPKIPDDLQKKIFDKFFTTKAKKNGSGLGLSIVRSVLEDHGAKLTLDSSEMETTFTFAFDLIDVKMNPENEVKIELL